MHPPTHVKDRLIVALDVETLADAERMVDRLEGLATRFKIGYSRLHQFTPIPFVFPASAQRGVGGLRRLLH